VGVTIPVSRSKLALSMVSTIPVSAEPGVRLRDLRPLNVPSAVYVHLTPAHPKVASRGWLDFSKGWQVTAGGGGNPDGVAHWSAQSRPKTLPVDGSLSDGSLEVVLAGLTPQTQFALGVVVDCEPADEGKPALEFRLFAGAAGPFSVIWSDVEPGPAAAFTSVPAGGGKSGVYVMIRLAETQFAVVTVSPIDLDGWSFYSAAAFKAAPIS
jgi:hypothetical protein